MRVKFYRSFNSLYSKGYKFSEPVLLYLVSAHCKSFILYGMEAISPTNSELNSLEYTYSSAICKIFKICHSSVASVLQFMHENTIKDCWFSRRLGFMQKCRSHDNEVVRFLCFFSDTTSEWVFLFCFSCSFFVVLPMFWWIKDWYIRPTYCSPVTVSEWNIFDSK